MSWEFEWKTTYFVIEWFNIKTKRNETIEIEADVWANAVTRFEWGYVGYAPIMGIRPK